MTGYIGAFSPPPPQKKRPALQQLLDALGSDQQQRPQKARTPKGLLAFVEKHALLLLFLCALLFCGALFANSYSIELQRLSAERLDALSFIEDAKKHSKHYQFLEDDLRRAEYMRDVSLYSLALDDTVNKTYLVNFARSHSQRLDAALDTAFSQMIFFLPLVTIMSAILVYAVVMLCIEYMRTRARSRLVRESLFTE